MRLIDADALYEKMIISVYKKIAKSGKENGDLDIFEIGYMIDKMPTLTLHWEVVQADGEEQVHG